VKKAEVNGGKRAGVLTELAESLKALEGENREPGLQAVIRASW
jgi:hypothetical protein